MLLLLLLLVEVVKWRDDVQTATVVQYQARASLPAPI